MKPLVIYHGGCRDGFCAAWVARLALGDAEFLAAQYGDLPPDVFKRNVYVLDFSYSRALMDDMAARATSLLVLDHHKTAEAALSGAPYARFDMNRSGAGMTWDHFFPGEPRHWLVDYVEDRDLWRWKLPHSRDVSGYLSAIDSTFEAFDSASLGDAKLVGGYLTKAIDKYVDTVSRNAPLVSFEGHAVPCVNTTHAVSELLGKLAEAHPFAIGWFRSNEGKFIYSLRSRGDFDVSELAKRYGGGGHKNAAGFQSTTLLELS